ncbi:MAG: hypothetical protein ACLGGW_09810 [Gammaproteobacteria bacterium]|jgi:hypothetical protein
MKKIGFILLIMLLPLQSAWAAVQLYHAHEPSESLVDVVFHNHTELDHDHAHPHSAPANHDSSSQDESSASDHHKFHVHSLSVLTTTEIPDFPQPAAVQHSRTPALQAGVVFQRIERPNWR